LDDLENRTLANKNPKLFLEAHPWPIIIDEIQKASPLLDAIKVVVDSEKNKCLQNNVPVPLMYVLTGSNQFELQNMVSESLAGRTAILNMASLANNELEEIDGNIFNPDLDCLKAKYAKVKDKNLYRSRKEIFERIFKGGMPEYIAKDLNRDTFFSSYIATYIEKDVKKIINVDKEGDFLRFLDYMALRTAQQINYDDISRNIGIDVRTVKNWISILVTSGIAILLEPYAKNMSDRITKAPKFYFMDTGLCAYLCKWPNAEMLENGVMNGAFYETYAVSEIIKSYINAGVDYRRNFYYYRDKDKKEADLIIDYVDHISPIEIKKGINPVSNNFNFDFLKKYGKPVSKGIVIDSREDLFPINADNWYCPIYMIGI
jgi:predicted AAA+ superfamily ATPase